MSKKIPMDYNKLVQDIQTWASSEDGVASLENNIIRDHEYSSKLSEEMKVNRELLTDHFSV